MNVNKVINQLRKEYSLKKIIKNNGENPTEIICEIDPTEKHPQYDYAIAVIDQSIPHYHKKITETYEVLKGDLVLTLDGKEISLKKGDKITIKPNTVHSAKGKETWVMAYSEPGWVFEDHILVD